jgi:predicted GNAT family N-acyltransferase
VIEERFRIEPATWAADAPDLRRVREAVFIDEQRIPPDEEWDEQDARAFHVIARDAQGQPIGTGRLTTDFHIGRMAVVKDWRGHGVGEAILCTLLETARGFGYPSILIHAQVYAMPFYERAGFVAEGEEYLEVGIPHRNMRVVLAPRETAPAQHALPELPPPQHFQIESLEQARVALGVLLQQAKYKLWIYTRDLDPLLFDQESCVAEIKRVALSGRSAEVRVLVQDPGPAVRDGHRLLHLMERLPSALQMRVPVLEEDRQYPCAYVLTDQGGFYFRAVASRYDGEASTRAVGRHGALLAHFEPAWERAEPSLELRRLSI